MTSPTHFRPPPGRRRREWLLVALALAGAACSMRTAAVHLPTAASPPAPPGAYRLVLIGDAGELREPEPVLEIAAGVAAAASGRATVLYLGDNAYPAGLWGDTASRAKAEATLRRQFSSVSSHAQVAFLPGNHDWANYGRGGLEAIREQAAFVRGLGASFLPAVAGCPGPTRLDLPAGAPVVRVVAFDSQWWVHAFERGEACAPGSRDAFVAALRAELQTSLPVVIAAHHPLATHGAHGGFTDWTTHLFPLRAIPGLKWAWIPLPGLGSIYPAVRRAKRHEQDLRGRRNTEMRDAIAEAVAGATAPPIVLYAAGHDHSQQVLEGPGVDVSLVTGGGASRNKTPVGCGRDTLYAHEADGFMVLDVGLAGVRLAVIDPDDPATSQRWFRLARGLAAPDVTAPTRRCSG
jgi:hypothetical protein